MTYKDHEVIITFYSITIDRNMNSLAEQMLVTIMSRYLVCVNPLTFISITPTPPTTITPKLISISFIYYFLNISLY